MPAFLIADVDVQDPDSYRAYREANPDVVRRFGGRYIALGGETRVLEGDWVLHRTIVIEFPDMDTLSRFYSSPEYEKLKPIRWHSADSRLLAIETLEEPID